MVETTVCPVASHFFAQQTLKQAVHMHVPLAALAGAQVKLQIGITRGSFADVLDRRIAQRRAAKVGMQDHSGGVDHGP